MKIFEVFKKFKDHLHRVKALEEFENEILERSSFLFLIFLAAVIASLGILRENQAVIIGAMIITPLVNPFVGVSLGVVAKRSSLIFRSLFRAVSGTVLFFITAYCMGKLFPTPNTKIWLLKTDEIVMIDIFIAITAGLVASLAISSEKFYNRLSGAAISLAIAPPLAVSAINLGMGNQYFFKTALTLFIINAAGLVIMGLVTFTIFGFRKKEEINKESHE